MDHPQTPSEVIPAQTENPAPVSSAPRPWTVKFVAPTQEGMSSDRLKARAELARIASGCDCCSCCY
jgi:hypothetical protein